MSTWLGWFARADQALTIWKTDAFELAIDGRGALASLVPRGADRNYLAKGQPSPLLTLRTKGQAMVPERARWEESTGKLTLEYGAAGAQAVVRVMVKSTHVSFELIELKSPQFVELALWGPYPIDISETIGEIVGVVRDRQVAVGIQSLNPKTIGGYPTNDNDVPQGHSGDDKGYYPNLPEGLRAGQGFRGDTARATSFGSVLQAYCRDRSVDRVISNWGHQSYRVPALADGGVLGSRIALFACPEPKALETIGAIELAEGLPHPLLDGVWDKISPGATASYLIVDFGEKTIDRAIEMTRRAGLRYLYHSSPFATWGHFKLKPELFPNGWEGFKACVDKARAAGIRLGFHTLSNFITPTDSYVSPTPDSRLAAIGETDLDEDITSVVDQIPLKDPELFRKRSSLNAVRIGGELIRFSFLSKDPPWRLMEAQRGAWGTRATAHSRGERVERLLDHDYKVLLPDMSLSLDVARQIAALNNQTGALQLSFDGLEGNWASGCGDYGVALFAKAWYDALDPSLRGQIINDASLPCHYNWHIHTRMNWGEPWYAGFRESQTLYRFKNQLLFQRNLMPHMLGWFALRNNTSLEDAEWLLARAAGFDAGFALAMSLASTAQLEADPFSAETAKRFGAIGAILEAIRRWETARMAGAFPEEVKKLLRDNQREFELRAAADQKTGWSLYEAQVSRFVHASTNGPAKEYVIENSMPEQGLKWSIQSVGKFPVSKIRLELNGRLLFDLKDRSLPIGGILKSAGQGECVMTDGVLKELQRLPSEASAERIAQGSSKLVVHADLPQGSSLKLEFRTLGVPISLFPRNKEAQ
ncbi:MAG: hypothetical protein JNN07_02300 [Verrucomicrobiales bacterium]|nr:hypothetical protein [Verrucomicrobiales bacterium]